MEIVKPSWSQAAIIAHLESVSGPVHFAPGTYEISETLCHIRRGHKVSIIGAGSGFTIFKWKNREGVIDPFIKIGTEYKDMVSKFDLRGFSIVDYTGPAAIRVSYAHRLYMQDVEIYCKDAYHGLWAECLWDSKLDWCSFVACGVTLMDGLYNSKKELLKCNNVELHSCRFEQAFGGLSIGRYGVRNRVMSCKFDRVSVPVTITGPTGKNEPIDPNIFIGNQFVECNNVRLITTSNSDHNVFMGNIFDCRGSWVGVPAAGNIVTPRMKQ